MKQTTSTPTEHGDATDSHGLEGDLDRMLQHSKWRRDTLRWLLGAGTAALFGCGGGSDSSAASSTASTGTTTGTGSSTGTTTGTTTGSTTCTAIPEETAGPYPGDGSNSSGGAVANALALSGIVRSDIRSSIAGATGVAQGVPLTVILDLVNSNASCADLAGYAVYLWHCDREGRYSMYSSGVTAENYLRGVQVSAADGLLTFQTVFPGCYSGRWPHIHFEIFRSANTATSWTNKLRTSQLALPADVCNAVYAGASGYTGSATNLSRITLASDGIFSDGVSTQMATVTGDLASGYVARLQVGLAA
jgi:protocatechuate 3,4-dioxygenase beta subunit